MKGGCLYIPDFLCPAAMLSLLFGRERRWDRYLCSDWGRRLPGKLNNRSVHWATDAALQKVCVVRTLWNKNDSTNCVNGVQCDLFTNCLWFVFFCSRLSKQCPTAGLRMKRNEDSVHISPSAVESVARPLSGSIQSGRVSPTSPMVNAILAGDLRNAANQLQVHTFSRVLLCLYTQNIYC